jgi:hypothetical protein
MADPNSPSAFTSVEQPLEVPKGSRMRRAGGLRGYATATVKGIIHRTDLAAYRWDGDPDWLWPDCVWAQKQPLK